MNARLGQLAVLLAIFAAILNLATSAVKEAVEIEPDGDAERIIAGQNATDGQFPWAAALHANGRFICTSSILNPTTVLTAAHCVVDGNGRPANPRNFFAIANYNKSSPNVRIDFERLIVHPQYDPSNIDNDIAIFRTTQPIPFSSSVQPVCIARPDTPMMEYRNATAMGWGNISPIRVIVIIPEILQYVEQTIVNNELCFYLGMTEKRLCATGFFNGVCNGDSGGPLVHLSADKPPVQIGITSYGNALFGCGKISPAVWTRVSAYTDFIMQNGSDGGPICTV